MKRSIDELNDNGHKAYYYITPKRRRTTQPATISIDSESDHSEADNSQSEKSELNHQEPPKSTPFVPLNGGTESILQAKLRFAIYDELKDNLMNTIEQIIQKSNDELYQNLLDFVTKEEPTNTENPGALIQPMAKIPVGYLSLTSNTANNHRILTEFYKLAMQQKHVKLVMLNSKLSSGSIKQVMTAFFKQLNQNTQRLMSPESEDDQPSDLDSDGDDYLDALGPKLEKFSYSPEYLHKWYAKQSFKSKLVIVFEDCATFDSQCLNKFLRLMAPYFGLYPMKLIFGVSNKNISNWLENNISSDYKMLLQNYKFVTKNNEQLFHQILQNIIITGDHKILIDEVLLTTILTRFEISNNSIDNLINELKLSLMIHFYSNPYSRLSQDPNITKEDVTILRRLPSFKSYIERSLHKFNKTKEETIKYEINDLLLDDNYVIVRLHTIKAEYQFIHTHLHTLIQFLNRHPTSEGLSIFEIYKLIISNRLSSTIFFNKLYEAIEFDESSEFLKKIDSSAEIDELNYHQKFLSTIEQFNCDKIFKEVFVICGNTFELKTPKVLENHTNLMVDLIRPSIRGQLLANLTDSDQYLRNELIPEEIKSNVQPLMVNLYNLLMEAPPVINHHEFFNAFKQSINKSKVINHLKALAPQELLTQCETDDKCWERLVFSWFLQICNEFMMLGLIKEKPRGDHFEKAIWPGL